MSHLLSVHQVFIFNHKFAGKTEETDHEKILYFYPQSTNLGIQGKSVGLTATLVGFSQTFSQSPCEALHTQKRRHVFLEAEPGYWITLVVNVPRESKYDKTVIYKHEEVSDSVLQAVLQTMYDTFKLFNGTMDSIVRSFGVDALKTTLPQFFTRYIENISFESLDIFDVLDGINFIPIDSIAFLKVHSFLATVTNRFNDQIHEGCFLYDKQLACTGISHNETRVLYKHLSPFIDERVRDSRSDGLFITGPHFDVNATNITPEAISKINAPTIFLGPDENLQRYSLIVFQYQKITLMLLIQPTALQNINFYREFKRFATQELVSLSQLLTECVHKLPTFDETYKYIYFNHMNLAIKTSLVKNKAKPTTSYLASSLREALNIITDIHSDFQKRKNEDGLKEVYLRTRRENWVVGKSFGEREFYVILEQRNMTLADVHDEMQKISSIFFSTTKKGEKNS